MFQKKIVWNYAFVCESKSGIKQPTTTLQLCKKIHNSLDKKIDDGEKAISMRLYYFIPISFLPTT